MPNIYDNTSSAAKYVEEKKNSVKESASAGAKSTEDAVKGTAKRNKDLGYETEP